jgi:hypothetical protein
MPSPGVRASPWLPWFWASRLLPPGVLERITYANEETGYTVARVTTGRSTDLLTVVGNLLGAQPGESLRMQGR